MVALPRAAGVALDGGLRGVPRTHGSISSGCTCPARPISRRPRRGSRAPRSQIAADRAHAVDVLLADGEAAAAGAVDVGEVAVGVEAVGELVGQPGQLVGAVLAGQAGQLRFGFVAGLDVDEVGQPMPKLRITATWPAPMSPLRCASAGRATPAAGVHRSTPDARRGRRPHGCAVMLRRG